MEALHVLCSQALGVLEQGERNTETGKGPEALCELRFFVPVMMIIALTLMMA